MAATQGTDTVFSEYEARELYLTVGETYWPIECIGKLEEEAEVRKVVKKCRGRVNKNKTFGTGSGTLKLTCHMPMACYYALHDMDRDDLAEGVYAYGIENMHPDVMITGRMLDEDMNEKLMAWPKCVASTGPKRNVENGAEEVAEIEMEISYAAVDSGYGRYEAPVGEVSNEIKSTWMGSFTPELVKIETV